MASVTGAIRTLSDKGLVEHEDFGDVRLTDAGRETARRIARRHEVLTSFLVDVLGLEAARAEDVACRMEHSMDPTVTDRLVRFAEFVQTCPRAGRHWLDKFHAVCETRIQSAHCQACVDRCKAELAAASQAAQDAARLSVADLEIGERGAVETVAGRGAVKRRIMDMGMVPGAVVEIIQVAPLGDPIEIKLKGYRLALRREEASRVRVRRL